MLPGMMIVAFLSLSYGYVLTRLQWAKTVKLGWTLIIQHELTQRFFIEENWKELEFITDEARESELGTDAVYNIVLVGVLMEAINISPLLAAVRFWDWNPNNYVADMVIELTGSWSENLQLD